MALTPYETHLLSEGLATSCQRLYSMQPCRKVQIGNVGLDAIGCVTRHSPFSTNIECV